MVIKVRMDATTREMLEAARFAVLMARPRCAVRFCESVVIERDGKIGFYDPEVTSPTVYA